MAVAGRIRAAAALAFVCALGVAPSAAAHNGVGAAFKGSAGRYSVYAYDGYRLPSGELEYRLVVLDSATGEPAESVAPVITARRAGGAGPTQSAHTTVMANVVLYDLPNSYPEDWSVAVSLSGPLGKGRVQFAMHGLAPYIAPAEHETRGGDTSTWVPVAAASAVALAAAGAF